MTLRAFFTFLFPPPPPLQDTVEKFDEGKFQTRMRDPFKEPKDLSPFFKLLFPACTSLCDELSPKKV